MSGILRDRGAMYQRLLGRGFGCVSERRIDGSDPRAETAPQLVVGE